MDPQGIAIRRKGVVKAFLSDHDTLERRTVGESTFERLSSEALERLLGTEARLGLDGAYATPEGDQGELLLGGLTEQLEDPGTRDRVPSN